MKNRIWKNVVLLICISIPLAMGGCGKKAENAASEKNPAKESSDSEKSAGTASDKEASKALYENFLKGKEKVYTEKREFYRYDYETEGGLSYYGDNEGFVLPEFLTYVGEAENDDSRVEGVKYAVLDCGLDGEPELGLHVDYTLYGDNMSREYIIKNIDGKLQLCYQMEDYYRSNERIETTAGYITTIDSFGMSAFGYDRAFVDGNGDYIYVYGMSGTYDASTLLMEDEFEPFEAALRKADPSGELINTYLARYSMEEFPVFQSDEVIEKYTDRYLYCAEQDDQPSNGVDFKLNVQIMKETFKDSKHQLLTQKEIKDKLSAREKEAGLTDAIINAPEPEWKALDVDLNACNGIKTVTVSNERQLLEAIDSKTIINLKPGHYNVTEGLIELLRKGKVTSIYADGYDEETDERYQENKCGVYYTFSERTPGLVISSLSELTIRAENPNSVVVIESDPRDEDVIRMDDCSEITFENVKMVHTNGSDACSGNVLELQDCRDVEIIGCDLAGCGATGLITVGSYNVKMTGGIIHECSVSCLYSGNSYDVIFENTLFEDVEGYTMFYAYNSEVTLIGCTLRNLAGNLVDDTDSANISFIDCDYEKREEPEPDYRTYILRNPSVDSYIIESSHISYPVKFKTLVDEANDITDDYDWFEKNDLWELSNRGDGRFNYVPYLNREGTDTLYELYMYDRESDELAYVLDLTEFYYQENIPYEYMNGWYPEFRYAWCEGDIVYISMSHMTYAETMPYNAFIIAVDLNDGSVLWKSSYLASNSNNFAVDGDLIYTGYGFTAEDDFIYQIDKYTGGIINTIPIRSKAYYLFIRDGHLYVRTYNRNLEYRLIHEN